MTRVQIPAAALILWIRMPRSSHGGARWVQGRPEELSDFSVNLNPLGPPGFVEEILEEAMKLKVYRYYPDQYEAAKERVAEIYGIDPGYIALTNGASEALYYIPKGEVPEPNFGELPRSRSYYAMETSNEFLYYLRGDTVITSNPVNPTGSEVSTREILAHLESGKRLFLDESFVDLSLARSHIKLIEDFPNLMVIGSFTKSLSVPGLRIGFVAGKGVRSFEKRMPPWRVNSLAYFLLSNLSVKEYRAHMDKTRDYLREAISGLRSLDRLKVYKTRAPFVLLETPVDSEAMKRRLLKEGYLIRSCKDFKGLRRGHIRISLRPGFDLLVNKLREVIEETGEVKGS